MRTCPGCGRTIGYLSQICGECAAAEAHANAQQEAAISLWASQGIHALEHYLAGWAAFDAWLAVHPPV